MAFPAQDAGTGQFAVHDRLVHISDDEATLRLLVVVGEGSIGDAYEDPVLHGDWQHSEKRLSRPLQLADRLVGRLHMADHRRCRSPRHRHRTGCSTVRSALFSNPQQ